MLQFLIEFLYFNSQNLNIETNKENFVMIQLSYVKNSTHMATKSLE